MEQDALFEVDAQPVVIPKRRSSSTGKPRWSKYRPKNPVKCDDCMLVLAETLGNGPASRQAKFKRVTPEGDLLLCYAHADVRRTEDGLDKLPGGAA